MAASPFLYSALRLVDKTLAPSKPGQWDRKTQTNPSKTRSLAFSLLATVTCAMYTLSFQRLLQGLFSVLLGPCDYFRFRSCTPKGMTAPETISVVKELACILLIFALIFAIRVTTILRITCLFCRGTGDKDKHIMAAFL